MVIYVDVLIFVNFFMDFLILKTTSRLNFNRLTLKRHILSSTVASLFSLYIFLPVVGLWFEMLIRVISSAVTVLTAFGFKNLKRFLRVFFIYYAVSFIFAGVVLGVQMIKPSDLVLVSNGIVYFDISPIVLITLSFVIYIFIFVFRKVTAKTADQAERYTVKLKFFNESVLCDGITDSGHTLRDAFGDSLVIIIDCSLAERLFGTLNTECVKTFVPPEDDRFKKRFRMMPVKTVSGEKMMPAVRIDEVIVKNQKGNIVLKEVYPIAVLSSEVLGDDFSVILPVI